MVKEIHSYSEGAFFHILKEIPSYIKGGSIV